MNASRLCSEAARRGFTLIELLTVIAIIGILAAIIIPTVGKVRAQAKSAQCISNLRQIAQAVLLYADENRGALPYGQTSANMKWHPQIEGYFGNVKSNQFKINATAVLTCPSVDRLPAADASNYAAIPSVMVDNKNNNKSPVNRTQILRPSQVAVVTDSGAVDGGSAEWGIWRQADVGSKSINDAEKPIPDSSSQQNAVIRWRHNGRANFAFADGHASSMRLGELQQRHLQIAY